MTGCGKEETQAPAETTAEAETESTVETQAEETESTKAETETAEDLGFTWEVVEGTFDGMIADLQGGGVTMDFVISGMCNTEKIREVIDFTQGYLTMKVGILYNKEDNFTSVEDVKGKTLSCGAGKNYANQIPYLTDNMTTFENSSVAVQELLADRTDGVMTDSTSCKKRCEENPQLAYFIVDYADIGGGDPLQYSMAFPKGSEYLPYFDAELTKMKEEGKNDEIVTKWLGAEAVDQ